MNATILTGTSLLTRHGLRYAWQTVLDAAAAARLAWQTRQRLDREHRERALMAELDPRMLRDIGAPDWLEGEARALREACHDEREQLRLDGASINTRYW